MTNERRLIQILKRLKHEETEQAPPEKLGISPSQVNIIDQLFMAKELTVKELSKNLNLKPPTVSVSVKKLEQISILKRKSHEGDGRVVLLMLTKKGFNIYNQIEKYRTTRVVKILNQINKEEQSKMLYLFEKALNIT